MQLTLENWKDEFLTLYQKPGTWRENEALVEKLLELQRQATIAEKDKEFEQRVYDFLHSLKMDNEAQVDYKYLADKAQIELVKYSHSKKDEVDV